MRRVLVCAQKPFGELCFERLLAAHEVGVVVAGVVSNERDDNWWGTHKVADVAQRLKLPFLANDQKDDAALLAFIAATRPDAILSLQHPWIMSSSVLQSVRGQAFNCHLAPLPSYKGWHGCSHAILNGDTTYGVTLHWMSTALDTGDIAYAESFPIDINETAKSLHEKATSAGILVFEKLLRDLVAKREPPRIKMAEGGRLYRRGDLDRLRELAAPVEVEVIERRARAFHFPPYEPAFIRHDNRKVWLVPEVAEAHRAASR